MSEITPFLMFDDQLDAAMPKPDRARGACTYRTGRTSLLVLCLALATPALLRSQAPETAAPSFRASGGSFVAIIVPDVEEAAAWYSSALGLQEVNRLEAEDGRYSIRILSGADLSVELLQLKDAAAPPAGTQLGLFKSGFFVDDIEAAHSWLRNAAPDTDEGIMVDEALRVRTFVFRDPYGNRLQVFQACGQACVR